MSQVEIYQSTDKQTQVHVTFEDESIDGTSGTLAPEGCTKVVREDTNQGRDVSAVREVAICSA